MYFNDHPPAHFHAKVAEDVALIDIETFEVLEGELPRVKLKLVREWARDNQEMLRAKWAELRMR